MSEQTHPIIEALNWRYATKRFDSEKKVSSKELNVILESIRLAPSSYGLQPFKVFIVETDKYREELKKACFNQTQPTDASHFLVFAAQTKISVRDVDQYMDNITTTRKTDEKLTESYGNFIKETISKYSEQQFKVWNSKQIYIALGMMMQTAAQLKIDTIAMEGFSIESMDNLLKLREKGLSSAVCCAIGYRCKNDANQHEAKVRKPHDEMFEFI